MVGGEDDLRGQAEFQKETQGAATGSGWIIRVRNFRGGDWEYKSVITSTTTTTTTTK